MSGRLDAVEKAIRETKASFIPGTWEKYDCKVFVDGKTLEALVEIAKAAQGFHEAFWMPWRSGRSDAMTADRVADAYGALRAALARLGGTTEETT